MSKLNLPPSWPRMGFTAKAGYLVDTHQARDYSTACSMLAQRRKKPPAPPREPTQTRLPYADN